MNYCLLCLIDVSVIAIHVFGEVQLGDSISPVIWLNISYESHFSKFHLLFLRDQQFQV